MKIFQKPFRFSLFVFLGLSLNLILLVSPGFSQYFTINRYHYDILIDRDSSFVVKETIEVTFDRPRHGIYRELPFKYREDVGHVIETNVHNRRRIHVDRKLQQPMIIRTSKERESVLELNMRS
jgi:hypothetical protein